MGIYRTLLEEEVPHLDDNNNPDEQIKELIDTVEDQDANAAEQDRAQEAEFAEPGTQADELLGESWMAIYEMESGMNTIMQAIGIHELSEAASGREFLMEAPDIKGFFKSIKDKVVAFFKKVWSVLQRWAGNIAAMFTTNKKFVEKYGATMETGFKIISSDRNAKSMSGYDFGGSTSDLDDFINSIDATSLKATMEGVEAIANIVDGKYSDTEFTAEQAENMINSVRGLLCGKPGTQVTAGEFSDTLKKNIYGEKKDDYLMPVAEVKAILSGKKDIKKGINKFMKECKTQMKKVLDSLKKAEAKLGKPVKDEGDEGANTRVANQAKVTRAINVMRQSLSATQIWRSAILGGINAWARQARRYGMAYVAAANRDKHKGFRKESTEYGFLGNLGLV